MSAMTLEQVRDWHLVRDREQRIVGFDLGAINHKGMADAIDANLTEIRAVIDELRIYDIPATNAAADKLTRALGNAQPVDVEKVRGLANQWRIRADNMSGSASSQRLLGKAEGYRDCYEELTAALQEKGDE